MSLLVAYPSAPAFPDRADRPRVQKLADIERSWETGLAEAGLPHKRLDRDHATLDGRSKRATLLRDARYLLVITGRVNQPTTWEDTEGRVWGVHAAFDGFQASHMQAATEAGVPIVIQHPADSVSLTSGALGVAIEGARSGPGCVSLELSGQIGQVQALMNE